MYAPLMIVAIVGLVAVALVYIYSQNQVTAREKEKVKGVQSEQFDKYSVQKEREDNKNKRGVGELLDPCPCAEGYECSTGDGNICKVKDNGTCRVSSDCTQSSFCFNALCTTKPDIEGERLILRNTPMLLQQSRFTVPKHWWKFTDIIDICQNPKESNIYYLLNDQGRIFKVDLNPKVNGIVEISQVTKIESIFFYDKHYYGISKGFLYQLENENDRVWNWGKVNKLYGDNISTYEIFEGNTVEDLLVLHTDQNILCYEKSKNEWSMMDENIKRITYGRTRKFYIKEDKNGNLTFHQGGKDHVLEGDIMDYAVSKDNDHIIYLLYGNNSCYMNIYDRKDSGADDVSIRILGKCNKIFTFKGNLWGMSTNEKYDFRLEE